MLSVVVWMWKGHDERRVFLPAHVNVFARMFKRELQLEHEVVCVTDSPAGLDESIVRFVQTPAAVTAVAKMPSPEHATRFPSCLRRIWNFSTEARAHFGNRILAADIDLTLLRDISDLCLYPQAFVGERPRMVWGNLNRVAGGLYLLATGAHPEVWDDFIADPEQAVATARREGFRGSDQAWISYKLGENAKLWPTDAGIYSVRDFLDKGKPVPANARLVQFNGPRKPWDCLDLEWVSRAWR